MSLCMKSARYLLTYVDCCLFLIILIIIFVSPYILLCIFNASSTPRCNTFILCKALWIVCTWNVLQINLTNKSMVRRQKNTSIWRIWRSWNENRLINHLQMSKKFADECVNMLWSNGQNNQMENQLFCDCFLFFYYIFRLQNKHLKSKIWKYVYLWP